MGLYAFFYLGSYFLFVALSAALLRSRELDGKLRSTLALVYLVGMMLGARAFYHTFCGHTLVNEPLRAFYAGLSERRGGLLTDLSGLRAATVGAGGLWGGPLFAMLMLVSFAVFLRLDTRTKHDFLDVFAVGFPYALAFAKAGCLVNGCCYGAEGSGLFYIRFTWLPKGSPCYMKSCFPTQLLDLLIYLSMATALLSMFRKSIQNGRLLLWFVLAFSVGRFATEFTRADNVGGKLLGLSPVQIVLLVSFIASIALLLPTRMFEWVLSLRVPRTGVQREGTLVPAPPNRSIERLDRYMLIYTVALVLALFVFPVLSLPLLALGILFVVRWVPILRGEGSAVQWSRAFNAFVLLALDVLFVTVFLLTNLVPFYLATALFVVGSAMILNGFLASIAASRYLDAGV